MVYYLRNHGRPCGIEPHIYAKVFPIENLELEIQYLAPEDIVFDTLSDLLRYAERWLSNEDYALVVEQAQTLILQNE